MKFYLESMSIISSLLENTQVRYVKSYIFNYLNNNKMSSNTEFCIWCYVIIPCIMGIVYNFIKLCNISGPTIKNPNFYEIKVIKIIMLVLAIIVTSCILFMITMKNNI